MATNQLADVKLPPGFRVVDYIPAGGLGLTFIELEGPRQVNSYDDARTFPGGISLYVPASDDPTEQTRHVAAAYIVWAIHEALEFTRTPDGQRLANPHPGDVVADLKTEDEMWTWLIGEVDKLLVEYTHRWPTAT